MTKAKPPTWKNDFPFFAATSPYHALVYADSAATTQKPAAVLEAMDNFYRHHYGTVHRSLYHLGEESTQAYEAARQAVADFIHASSPSQCIFTRGTTEAINCVAHGLSHTLSPGDIILVGEAEHHSNLVPWQLLAARTHAQLVPIPVLASGDYDQEAFLALLDPKVKIIAMAHVSNVSGAVHHIHKFIQMAHAHHIPILIDGAQAVGHIALDLNALDCDYYVFSGHKMYGPTGIGILYGKTDALERLAIFQGGGEMIRSVSFQRSDYAELPARLEAGTPAIAEAIGLKAAIDYLNAASLQAIQAHELSLAKILLEGLKQRDFIQIVGSPKELSAIISFLVKGIHPHDAATFLDTKNIAIRAGHHCAEPLMVKWGLPGTARVSFGLYSTEDDVRQILEAIDAMWEFFHR